MSQLIERYWAGSGSGNAPAADNLPTGMIGADNNGASTGLTYHVVNKAWVATGGTVQQLYGGA